MFEKEVGIPQRYPKSTAGYFFEEKKPDFNPMLHSTSQTKNGSVADVLTKGANDACRQPYRSLKEGFRTLLLPGLEDKIVNQSAGKIQIAHYRRYFPSFCFPYFWDDFIQQSSHFLFRLMFKLHKLVRVLRLSPSNQLTVCLMALEDCSFKVIYFFSFFLLHFSESPGSSTESLYTCT